MKQNELRTSTHYPVPNISALIDFLCFENKMAIENRFTRVIEAKKLVLEFLKNNASFSVGKTKSIVGIAMLSVYSKTAYYYEEKNRQLFNQKYNLIHDIGCVIDYLELTRGYTREQAITHALDVLIHSNRFYFGKETEIQRDIDLFLKDRISGAPIRRNEQNEIL